MLPIWRDDWLFLFLDGKSSRERDVPERLLVEPLSKVVPKLVVNILAPKSHKLPWPLSDDDLPSEVNYPVSKLKDING